MNEFKLSKLGKYKIDRTEDYGWAKSTGEDLTYYEMIRVKGSKPEKIFGTPSHLYKYSDNYLILYLKDHKNYWRPLSKLLNHDIDINDDEVLFKFLVDRFKDVSKIVKFVKKKGSNELSENFLLGRQKTYFKHGEKIEHNNKNLKENAYANTITLEHFNGD